VAPADVTQVGRVDQRGDGVAQRPERPAVPRVEQQRPLVADEEVVELHVQRRLVQADPEHVRRDLVDGGHGEGLRVGESGNRQQKYPARAFGQ